MTQHPFTGWYKLNLIRGTRYNFTLAASTPGGGTLATLFRGSCSNLLLLQAMLPNQCYNFHAVAIDNYYVQINVDLLTSNWSFFAGLGICP